MIHSEFPVLQGCRPPRLTITGYSSSPEATTPISFRGRRLTIKHCNRGLVFENYKVYHHIVDSTVFKFDINFPSLAWKERLPSQPYLAIRNVIEGGPWDGEGTYRNIFAETREPSTYLQLLS